MRLRKRLARDILREIIERSHWANHDGCEYNPETKEPSCDTDDHFRGVLASWVVGANGKWRLCDDCARLPEFRRLRKRERD